MLFDSHVHSAASPDSELLPDDAIAAAASKGLGIAFTEHIDFSERNNKKDPDAADAIRGIGDFCCEISAYPGNYQKFRGANVSIGLEFGLTRAFAQENKRIAQGDYDFILGAIHSVDGVELYHACAGTYEKFGADEPYARAIFSGDAGNATACLRRYLIYAREMVECSDYFDSFAHIDYISRYSPVLAAHFFYENFAEEFDALLRALADRERALEVNTKLLTGAAEESNRLLKICRRFRELGGRLATVGSDAHNAQSVGHSIREGCEIAAAAGLAVVHFKKRKAVRCG
ncbi:MAG: histidinol-phosphatase HisJ family protein [Defluviitaleaceae bacterium]|nr:histidinol-phosphatase HisJ family protein [Defluviitaleaceae bacterium]